MTLEGRVKAASDVTNEQLGAVTQIVRKDGTDHDRLLILGTARKKIGARLIGLADALHHHGDLPLLLGDGEA